MTRTIVLSTVAIAFLGSAAILAQAQQPAQQQNQLQPEVATFFVAENSNGTGNLGGLTGADQMCQTQAQALGGKAATRTWHAYLSQEQRGNTPSINARNRIGAGPWFNVKGQLIASNVADLHGDQARDRNSIRKASSLTEKGEMVNGFGDMPNQHDMLTGSDSDGRAFTDGLDHTCNNWTSDAATNRAMLGHHYRNGNGNVSWNSAHMSRDCTAAGLVATGGAGKFYCFAIN
jgi:hypothetical protein